MSDVESVCKDLKKCFTLSCYHVIIVSLFNQRRKNKKSIKKLRLLYFHLYFLQLYLQAAALKITVILLRMLHRQVRKKLC
jgi:hypothetical protein